MASTKTIIITQIPRSGPNSVKMASLLSPQPPTSLQQPSSPTSRFDRCLQDNNNNINKEQLCSAPPRKRQRLDHLSMEEKMMRRKLKNRVAAQSARDRKRALMQDLEVEVRQLELTNSTLQEENKRLLDRNAKLEAENAELRRRLEAAPVAVTTATIKQEPMEEESTSKNSCQQSVEYAEGTGRAGSCSLDDALRWFADVEPDELLDVLQELSKELDGKDTRTEAADRKVDEDEQPVSRVVGPSPEELESIKELIKFDHVYYKAANAAAQRSLLSAADKTDSTVPESKLVVSTSGSCSDDDDSDISMTRVCLAEDSSPDIDTSAAAQPTLDVAECITVDDDDDDDVQVLKFPSLCETLSPVGKLDEICASENISSQVLSLSDQFSPKDTLSPASSLSDAGYDSASSVLSPFSDCGLSGSLLEDNMSWEESFQELFPSLL